jgi:hypothetical protein
VVKNYLPGIATVKIGKIEAVHLMEYLMLLGINGVMKTDYLYQ